MTVSPPLLATLRVIGTVMEQARDPWWIIASAAVALHGVDAGRVADVDVLLSVTDAKRVLPALGIEPQQGSAHPAFRSSIFGTWTAAALPVEFMADFQRWSGAAWVPVQPATRHAVKVDTVNVFIPDRPELQAMLAAFGRPKDLERLRSLAALA